MTRLALLFQRYFDKTATPQEVDEFLRLADKEEHAAELRALMEDAWRRAEPTEPVFSAEQSEAMLKGVMEAGRVAEGGDIFTGGAKPGAAQVRALPWRKLAAAAAVAAILGGAAWWFAQRQKPRPAAPIAKAPPVKRPIVPGTNQATLILGDGSTIALDSAHQGTLAHQGETDVVQMSQGHLAYTRGEGSNAGGTTGANTGGATGANAKASGATGAGASGATGAGSRAGASTGAQAVAYNMVKTPRGGQYQVVLPDGSKVWLNAAASLRFPTAFTGKDRTVELTGEGYFEVAARPGQPFRVKVNDMQVEVLGTHFDVMAYPEEDGIHTSLLQGAVRVEKDADRQVLRPGQEAVWNGRGFQVAEVDTDQAVAWKNGLFHFDGATLETVMRQVCRWYDVDVRYEGTVPRHFSGLISRSVPLTEVLRMLDMAGRARFTLEGRTVVVKAT